MCTYTCILAAVGVWEVRNDESGSDGEGVCVGGADLFVWLLSYIISNAQELAILLASC